MRSELWTAAVNVEFFSRQERHYCRREKLAQTLLTIGTVAGITPIFKGVQAGVSNGFSVISIGCGLFGIMGLPLFDFKGRLALLCGWKSKWIDIRRIYCDILRSGDFASTESIQKWQEAQNIEMQIEKEPRQIEHYKESEVAKLAEADATAWFQSKGV